MKSHELHIIACLSLAVAYVSSVSAPISRNMHTSVRCPKNYFLVGNMTQCHPLLTCSDLEEVNFVKLVGYGAVKWVFLAEWNHVFIAVSVLRTPIYSEDYDDGLNFLRSLAPNRFVVQLVGYCKRSGIIATEYHRLNNANSLKYVLGGAAPSFGLAMNLCLNFVGLLRFLHESPVGVRVNCDSDSVEKILSQIVVTDALELVLCDVDALPEFLGNVTISCGRNIRHAPTSMVPPELTDPDNPGYPVGYSVKSDVWKVPDVCNEFFSLAKADAISFFVHDVTRKCKNVIPFERPSSAELFTIYRKKFVHIRSKYFKEWS